jgi:hypothetical protein
MTFSLRILKPVVAPDVFSYLLAKKVLTGKSTDKWVGALARAEYVHWLCSKGRFEEAVITNECYGSVLRVPNIMSNNILEL